ncbi:MAG: ATP synthase F1 subunit delta [Phycisphaerae bacterium]
MPGVDGQKFAIARVYSKAMLQLAQSHGEADWLLDELLDFAAQVDKDADLNTFLSSPNVDVETRRKTLEKLFRGRYSDLFVDSLQVLNRKDRLGLVRAVAEAYRLAHEELRGRVEVHVRTAVPLTDPLREKLKAVAAKQTGKEVDLVETLDESLIGGLVVQIDDQKFDASLATRLKGLCSAMLDRASREIHSGKTYLEERVI